MTATLQIFIDFITNPPTYYMPSSGTHHRVLQPSSSSLRFGLLASCGSVVRILTFPRMSYGHKKKPTQFVAWGPAPAPEDPPQLGRTPKTAVANSLNKGRSYKSVFPELASTLATTSLPSPGLELAPLGFVSSMLHVHGSHGSNPISSTPKVFLRDFLSTNDQHPHAPITIVT
jgi:hypothetical protein